MEKILIYPKKYSSKNKHIIKILIFIIFLFSINIQSQTIQILDKKNNQSIYSVLVEIESVNQNLLEKNYGFTNKNGCLQYNITPPFKITTNHISYKEYINVFNQEDVKKKNDTLIIFLEPSYQPLEEVIITGQIGSQNKTETMNTFITISSEKIENMSSNNLGELLSNEALFDLNIDPALGTSLSIQGMQGNNVNILIDGVPIIGRKGGQIDLAQIEKK